MKRLLLALACLALPMAFWAAPAGAQAPVRDSVTGTASQLAVPPSFVVTFTFDASSGPAGQDPTGNVAIQGVFGPVNPVTCLKVEGNRAIVGVALTSQDPPRGLLIYVTDVSDVGLPPPDLIGVVSTDAPPEVCSEQPHTESEIVGGNITVVDAEAPFPTSKEQCQNGGWRNYPQFKNRGQCIKFVNRAA
jgi:hypothetical protein